MKTIDLKKVDEELYNEIGKSGIFIDKDVKKRLEKALNQERNPLAKDILSDLLLNGEVAEKLQKPLCQDTGLAVLFVEVGTKIQFAASLEDTINSAIKRAYQDFYFRKSMVASPIFERKNTNTNLPAIIHWNFKSGDELKISFAAKGGGSENMSRLMMLKPSDGVEGVKKFVVKSIVEAKSNPCPPLIIGVGVGGNFESCAILAKKALFRDLDDSHPEQEWANLEEELLSEINKTNVGPQGLGGDTTALAVKVEYLPCHIASLPVAVNLQCHSHRHFTLTF